MGELERAGGGALRRSVTSLGMMREVERGWERHSCGGSSTQKSEDILPSGILLHRVYMFVLPWVDSSVVVANGAAVRVLDPSGELQAPAWWLMAGSLLCVSASDSLPRRSFTFSLTSALESLPTLFSSTRVIQLLNVGQTAGWEMASSCNVRFPDYSSKSASCLLSRLVIHIIGPLKKVELFFF